MLSAVSRTLSISGVARPSLAALAAGLPAGRHPLPEPGAWPELIGVTEARFGAAEVLRAELWVLEDERHPPALCGSVVAIPGRHAVRWLVGLEGRLELQAGVRGDRAESVGEGEARCWDLDRDPAGIRATGRWTGVAVDLAAGPLRGLTRPPAARASRLGAAFVEWVGFENALYVLVCAALSLALRSPVALVAGTSFVHYGIYVATFARRRDIAYGEFLRDASWFKAWSMAHLGWIALSSPPWSPGWAAIGALGVALSLRAAQVLGLERTYFGVELGRIPPARVERFPYGWIPHPMIVGAVIGLVGVGAQPGVARGWPWLVPLHVLAYAVHLAQEVFHSGHSVSAGSAPERHRAASLPP